MIRILLVIIFMFAANGLVNAQLINGSIIVTEINYHSDTTVNSGDWFELYNTSSNAVNIGGFIVRDQSANNLYTIPSGTTIGGNAYLVVINNTTNFTSLYPSVSNYIGNFLFGLGNSTDQIRLFDNNNVLQYSVTYQDTLDWPKGADGDGRTLELVSTSSNPNLATSWFDGCMLGSPGVAYQPCDPQIVVSEINYNSDTLNDCDDWLELHNRSGSSMTLTGWRLRDSRDSNVYVFPTLTMPASSYLVVVNDLVKFEAIHSTVSNKIGDLGFSLSNGGESIRLYNASNELQFSMIYNDTLPWPEEPDGDGYTLELLDATGHMNDAANWFKGCFLGSPGVAYSPDCPDGVELTAFDFVKVYPINNFSAYNIEWIFDSNSSYVLYDALERLHLSNDLVAGNNYINVNQLASGIYFLRLQHENQIATYKLFVP